MLSGICDCFCIMKVEISKEQKEALGKKIDLCVDFLKKEVQPHVVKSDILEVFVQEELFLFVTSSKIYATASVPVIPGVDLCLKKVLLLENPGRKQAKKYICEANPELAVVFLKNWERVKSQLIAQVAEKTKKVDELNQFVDNFEL